MILLDVTGECVVWSSPLEEAELPEEEDDNDEEEETENGRRDVHPEGYFALLDGHQVWVGNRFYLQLNINVTSHIFEDTMRKPPIALLEPLSLSQKKRDFTTECRPMCRDVGVILVLKRPLL